MGNEKFDIEFEGINGNKRVWFCPYSAVVIEESYIDFVKGSDDPILKKRVESYLYLTMEELISHYKQIIILTNEILGRNEFEKVKKSYRLANNL